MFIQKKKKVRSDVNLNLMKNSATLSNRRKTKTSSTDSKLNQLEIERYLLIRIRYKCILNVLNPSNPCKTTPKEI